MYIMSDEKGSKTDRPPADHTDLTGDAANRPANVASGRRYDYGIYQVCQRHGFDDGVGASPSIMASESVQYIFYDKPGSTAISPGKSRTRLPWGMSVPTGIRTRASRYFLLRLTWTAMRGTGF